MSAPLAPVVGLASDLAAPLLRAVGATPSRRVAHGRERTHVDEGAEGRPLAL